MSIKHPALLSIGSTFSSAYGRYRVERALSISSKREDFLGITENGQQVLLHLLRPPVAPRDRAELKSEVLNLARARAAEDRAQDGVFLTPLFYGADIEAEQPYLIKEYIQGSCLAEILSKGMCLSEPLALEACWQLFRTLHLVHTDVRLCLGEIVPERLWWNAENNTLKILDWGRLVQHTPENMVRDIQQAGLCAGQILAGGVSSDPGSLPGWQQISIPTRKAIVPILSQEPALQPPSAEDAAKMFKSTANYWRMPIEELLGIARRLFDLPVERGWDVVDARTTSAREEAGAVVDLFERRYALLGATINVPVKSQKDLQRAAEAELAARQQAQLARQAEAQNQCLEEGFSAIRAALTGAQVDVALQRTRELLATYLEMPPLFQNTWRSRWQEVVAWFFSQTWADTADIEQALSFVIEAVWPKKQDRKALFDLVEKTRIQRQTQIEKIRQEFANQEELQKQVLRTRLVQILHSRIADLAAVNSPADQAQERLAHQQQLLMLLRLRIADLYMAKLDEHRLVGWQIKGDFERELGLAETKAASSSDPEADPNKTRVSPPREHPGEQRQDPIDVEIENARRESNQYYICKNLLTLQDKYPNDPKIKQELARFGEPTAEEKQLLKRIQDLELINPLDCLVEIDKRKTYIKHIPLQVKVEQIKQKISPNLISPNKAMAYQELRRAYNLVSVEDYTRELKKIVHRYYLTGQVENYVEAFTRLKKPLSITNISRDQPVRDLKAEYKVQVKRSLLDPQNQDVAKGLEDIWRKLGCPVASEKEQAWLSRLKDLEIVNPLLCLQEIDRPTIRVEHPGVQAAIEFLEQRLKENHSRQDGLYQQLNDAFSARSEHEYQTYIKRIHQKYSLPYPIEKYIAAYRQLKRF